jgi:orotidine-5'-phosphate decarboxylase
MKRTFQRHPDKRAKDYIVFALDVSSEQEAKKLIRCLSGHVGMFKVGLELFIRSGPDIIRFIRESGPTEVFLDLKLHDIPQTVFRAMASIADIGVSFTTVHCGENIEMLKAAVKGAGKKVTVLGVTVLTSVSEQDLKNSGYHDNFSSNLINLVMKRVTMAQEAGCAGVVCSGKEVTAIKKKFGHPFLTIAPGIRPGWEKTKDDQARVVTPGQAVLNGADYLVIGRPIRDAKDPRSAADRIAEEIDNVLLSV